MHISILIKIKEKINSQSSIITKNNTGQRFMVKITKKIFIPTFLALIISGCHSGTGMTVHDHDKELQALIKDNNLTGDPSTGRDIPKLSDPQVVLGKKLFYSKALGGDLDSACVTCHHPSLGGGDTLVLPIGAEAVEPNLLGKGRAQRPDGTNFDGGPTVARNAPSTYNVALYNRSLFWDGRIESVTPDAGYNGSVGGIITPDSNRTTDPDAGSNLVVAQARFPQIAPPEMRGFTFEAGNTHQAAREHLAQRFAGTRDADLLPKNEWLKEFQKGYDSNETNASALITVSNIVEALGAYERSQLFIDTPWKHYIDGDVFAISEEAKKGAILFFTPVEKGGANCVVCHSGDFFTDEEYHAMAVPQIGRGKGNGTHGDDDFGRYNVTKNSADMYKFRTPTLLNVAKTGPWGHSGAYTSLSAIVRHMSQPAVMAKNYDESQVASELSDAQLLHREENTDKAVAQFLENRKNGINKHQDKHLTDEEVSQLVAFLNTLTDVCVADKKCISKWTINATVPGVEDPDGLLLRAVDRNGNPL